MAFDLVDRRSEGILKFGDSVSLFFCPSSNVGSDRDNQLKSGGFLSAQGIVEMNLSIQQVKDQLPPASFRECLFQLWPMLTYSMQEVCILCSVHMLVHGHLIWHRITGISSPSAKATKRKGEKPK